MTEGWPTLGMSSGERCDQQGRLWRSLWQMKVRNCPNQHRNRCPTWEHICPQMDKTGNTPWNSDEKQTKSGADQTSSDESSLRRWCGSCWPAKKERDGIRKHPCKARQTCWSLCGSTTHRTEKEKERTLTRKKSRWSRHEKEGNGQNFGEKNRFRCFVRGQNKTLQGGPLSGSDHHWNFPPQYCGGQGHNIWKGKESWPRRFQSCCRGKTKQKIKCCFALWHNFYASLCFQVSWN